MLINFCDSAFAIGESHQDTRMRYFKQIKARNTEVKYHSEQVCVCQLAKPLNFLQFSFLSYGEERQHLEPISNRGRTNKIKEAMNMKAAGSSNVAIGQALGISEGTVRHWIKKSVCR